MLNIKIPDDFIQEVCKQYHIRKLSIFGSALRDDFSSGSDVDVLIEFESDSQPTLLDLAAVQRLLSKNFGRPVDLGTPDSLSPYIRSKVISMAQVIYERS